MNETENIEIIIHGRGSQNNLIILLEKVLIETSLFIKTISFQNNLHYYKLF